MGIPIKTRREQTLEFWKEERDTLQDWINTIDYSTPYEVRAVIESRVSELKDWIDIADQLSIN